MTFLLFTSATCFETVITRSTCTFRRYDIIVIVGVSGILHLTNCGRFFFFFFSVDGDL